MLNGCVSYCLFVVFENLVYVDVCSCNFYCEYDLYLMVVYVGCWFFVVLIVLFDGKVVLLCENIIKFWVWLLIENYFFLIRSYFDVNNVMRVVIYLVV